MTKLTSRRVVWTSFLVDLSDILLNVLVAILSGSAVLIAEALQGTADLATSGLLLIGLKRARRRPNKSHPFGFGREIYFWTLMAGITMFLVTAVTSIAVGWNRVLHHQPILNFGLASAVLLIGTVTNSYALGLSLKRLRQARPDQSVIQTFTLSDLIETKATFILDLMGSFAALLGLLAYGIYALSGDFRFDGIGAMAIGLATAIFSLFLMVEVKDLLVGRGVSAETEADIRRAAERVKGVVSVVGVQSMYLGSEQILVHLDVKLQHRTTKQIEQLIDRIKARVIKAVPSVRHLQVEVETPPKVG